MVFSRKQDRNSTEPVGTIPLKRTSDRSVIAHAHHASTHGPSESVIGNDLSIEGETITIRCKGTLRVNGDISADLHSKELEVGREGRISGSITAHTVNVFGQVSGAIQGGRVILHATAQVEGDIHSANLAIESGASFDGRSKKAHNPEDIQPELEKNADLEPQALESHASGVGHPTLMSDSAPHSAESPFSANTDNGSHLAS